MHEQKQISQHISSETPMTPRSSRSVIQSTFEKTGSLQFCGIEIQVDRESSQPYIIMGSSNNIQDRVILSDMGHLVKQLNNISHLYSQPNTHGQIVLVDDQYVSQQSIYYFFNDLGLSDRLHMFSNGKEAVMYFDRLLEKCQKQKPTA